MSVHYLPESEAARGRPDFEARGAKAPGPGLLPRVGRFLLVTIVFFGSTFALAGLFFVPVLVASLSRVEILEIAGRPVSAAMFADELVSLFWGTFILALAFTSFIAGAALSAAGPYIRPHHPPAAWEDPRRHPAVLRLIGAER